MLFNQMSNSTGLWYTGQPSHLCYKWMQFLCTFKQTHWNTCRGVSTHSRWRCLLSAQSFWVNNFDIRNIILSTVCEWGEKEGKKSSLECLVYVIYSLSAVYVQGNTLTFQKLPCHFKNNWPVLCAEPTQHQVNFFSTCNRAAKLLSLFSCWQCVNM